MATDLLQELALGGARPLASGGRVAVLDPNGTPGTIEEKDLDEALRNGYTLQSPEGHHEQVLQQRHGDSPVSAFLGSAASMATLGVSDAFRGVEPEDREALAAERRLNPLASTAGSITGALLPIGAGGLMNRVGTAAAERAGGTALVEGLLAGGARHQAASKTAAGLAEVGASPALLQSLTSGGSAAARAAGAGIKLGARGAAEGALVGVQQTVSEVALSDDPMNAEAIAAELGSNVLLGGATGGVAGGALGSLGSVAKAAAVRARNSMSRWAEGEARSASIPDDISRMDLGGAKAARADELAKLKTARLDERDGLRKSLSAEQDALKAARLDERKLLQQQKIDEIKAIDAERAAEADAVGLDALVFREALRDAAADLPKVAKMAADLPQKAGLVREVKEAERAFNKIVDAVNARPQQALGTLRSVERTIGNMRTRLAEAHEKAATEAAGKPMTWDEFRAGKASQYAKEMGLGPSQKRLSEEYKAYKAAFAAGSPVPTTGFYSSADKIAQLDDVLEQASALHQRLTQVTAPRTTSKLGEIEARLGAELGPPTSPRLTELEARLAEIERATPGSERLTALDDHITGLRNPPIGKQIGQAVGGAALATVGGAIGGGIGSLVGIPWIGGVVGASAGAGFGVLRKKLAASAAGMTTKIANGIDKVVSGASHAAPSLARAAAVGALAIADRDEDKPATLEQRVSDVIEAVANIDATRQRVRDSLAGIRVVDVKLADQLEEAAMRRLEYYAKKAPKVLGLGTLGGGSDQERPSDAALGRFAQCVAVGENPLRILDELAADMLTPEAVETAKYLHPEFWKRMQEQLLDKVMASGKPIPRARRLSLSMVLDAPVSATMRPEFITAMQAGYEAMRHEEQQNKPSPQGPSQSKQARAVTDAKPTEAQLGMYSF
jgi:hypothetical protein